MRITINISLRPIQTKGRQNYYEPSDLTKKGTLHDRMNGP